MEPSTREAALIHTTLKCQYHCSSLLSVKGWDSSFLEIWHFTMHEVTERSVKGRNPSVNTKYLKHSPAQWKMGATAAQNQFGSAASTTQVYSHRWKEWKLFAAPTFHSTGTFHRPSKSWLFSSVQNLLWKYYARKCAKNTKKMDKSCKNMQKTYQSGKHVWFF